MSNNQVSVAVMPEYDLDRGYRQWHIRELFTGKPGDTGQYVPNVDDTVFNPKGDEKWYRVTSMDITTLKWELAPVQSRENINDLNKVNQLIGTGPGHISESYRLRLNTSVKPFVAQMDGRLHTYSQTTNYYQIFAFNEDGTKRIVSRRYDASGVYVGDTIPMIRTTNEMGDQNAAIWAPRDCNLSEAFDDGEPLQVIFYTDTGGELYSAILLVANTDFTRDQTVQTRYIESIELVSPFISLTDDRFLDAPANVPNDHITRSARIHYTDGSSRSVIIDGSKCKLMGLDLIPTEVGNTHPLELVYFLSSDEGFEGNIGGDSTLRKISTSYQVRVIQVDNAYNVKLFTYPVWVDDVYGYRLRHFLCTLDRERTWEVTDKVVLAPQSAAFEPKQYGSTQRLTFELDLASVDPKFKHYNHLQTTEFVLRTTGTDQGLRWQVRNDRSKPAFGTGPNDVPLDATVKFNNGVLWTLNIDCGVSEYQPWIDHVYGRILPITNPRSEAQPLEPTHVRVIAGDNVFISSIAVWNQNITIDTILNTGDVVFLQFLRRDSNTDHELGTAGLPVRFLG